MLRLFGSVLGGGTLLLLFSAGGFELVGFELLEE